MLILALRFHGGYTQQQIAERIGVTQMQVSRLISQLLARLRDELAGAAGHRGRRPRRRTPGSVAV